MKKNVISFLSILIILFVTTKKANALNIDFESLSDGDVVTTQFPGLTFSNATALTAGISLNEFEFPPHSGDNVVFDDSDPMTIDFSTPMADIGAYFTYLVPLTVDFFDPLHNLVGTVNSLFLSNLTLSGDLGSSPNEFLNFAWASGISQMTITGDPLGGSFTMDDLQGTPVPEPTSLLLLVSGLAGMVGYGWRRLRKET